MKITYRPEIDGLRAIAVIAVILYHAQIVILGNQPFKGGFIGVDIFFVISGYLITSIILKELIVTGKFSFKNFYERRVRRILPALLFVIVVSLPFAYMYLIPGSLVDFSKSLLNSLSFSSNFYFHFSGQEYAAENSLLKPLLHTWSLSVEEQYYILFPIILFFTFKYFKKYTLIFLLIVFTISLIFSEWGSRNHPSLNFYIIVSRGWELLIGSILAYFEIRLGHRSKNQKLNNILPSLGLTLILLNIVFFKLYFRHPSFYTLPSIIGTCLVIWFSTKNEIVTKLLSSKLFVKIGLISYSLYLWHYPIFAFARINEFFNENIFVLGVSLIVLSTVSYFFVERPARNKKYKFIYILTPILFLYILLVFVNLHIISKNGFKKNYPDWFLNNLNEKPYNLLKNSEGEKCFRNIEGCTFNDDANKKVFLIGDSQMATIMFDLKDKVVNRKYQFNVSTIGSCILFPGFDRVLVKTKKIDKNCNNDYFLRLENTLNKEKNSIVILGGRFPVYLTNYWFNNQEGGIEDGKWNETFVSRGNYETIQDSFKDTLNEISKKNKIILIYPIPETGWHVPKKLHQIWLKRKNKFSNDFITDPITTSYQVYKDRTESSFNLLDSIKGKNIYRVYPHELFCDRIKKGRCATHDNKSLFYVDEEHTSLLGSEMINDLIMEEIKKIESKID
jgi:peptidoglycan/LPS O-acetylase OafA/YrhL